MAMVRAAAATEHVDGGTVRAVRDTAAEGADPIIENRGLSVPRGLAYATASVILLLFGTASRQNKFGALHGIILLATDNWLHRRQKNTVPANQGRLSTD